MLVIQRSQNGEQSSKEQHIALCQHPEGTHIYAVEQVRPQGMQKQADKTTKYVTTKTAGILYPQYRVTIRGAILVEKHTKIEKKN